MKLEGENKWRLDGEQERRKEGREAERALRQEAFWFKAVTLVSDVWEKEAQTGKTVTVMDCLSLGVCVCLQACEPAGRGMFQAYPLYLFLNILHLLQKLTPQSDNSTCCSLFQFKFFLILVQESEISTRIPMNYLETETSSALKSRAESLFMSDQSSSLFHHLFLCTSFSHVNTSGKLARQNKKAKCDDMHHEVHES